MKGGGMDKRLLSAKRQFSARRGWLKNPASDRRVYPVFVPGVTTTAGYIRAYAELNRDAGERRDDRSGQACDTGNIRLHPVDYVHRAGRPAPTLDPAHPEVACEAQAVLGEWVRVPRVRAGVKRGD